MMRNLEAKQRIAEIICFTEHELKSTIDYSSYLNNSKDAEELWRMQMTSQAYSEWLSVENDIYDEVFTSEI